MNYDREPERAMNKPIILKPCTTCLEDKAFLKCTPGLNPKRYSVCCPKCKTHTTFKYVSEETAASVWNKAWDRERR